MTRLLEALTQPSHSKHAQYERDRHGNLHWGLYGKESEEEMFGWALKDAPSKEQQKQHAKTGRVGHSSVVKVQKEPRLGAGKDVERGRQGQRDQHL